MAAHGLRGGLSALYLQQRTPPRTQQARRAATQDAAKPHPAGTRPMCAGMCDVCVEVARSRAERYGLDLPPYLTAGPTDHRARTWPHVRLSHYRKQMIDALRSIGELAGSLPELVMYVTAFAAALAAAVTAFIRTWNAETDDD